MDGDADFPREALAVLVNGIMDSEASVKAGAGYGERSPDRVTQRNGYRSRAWDTRVGHASGHDGVAHTEVEGRELLPESA
jgi:transposase-like protein